jgi:hypothetical protein
MSVSPGLAHGNWRWRDSVPVGSMIGSGGDQCLRRGVLRPGAQNSVCNVSIKVFTSGLASA